MLTSRRVIQVVACAVALLVSLAPTYGDELHNAVDPLDSVNESTTVIVVGGETDGVVKNVLIYEEFTLGTSAYIEALNRQVIEKGWGYTLVMDGFAFQAALANDLAGTGTQYDHVISSHQDSFGAGTWDQGLGTGGLADWAMAHPEGQVLISDWRVNNPQPYLAALGFGYTGNTNLTNVTGVPGTVLDGKGGNLFSPGWGIFSYGVTGPLTIATDGATGKPIAAQNGKWYFNGFLSDTFVVTEEGIQIVLNEIKKLGGEPTKGACCFEDGTCAVLESDECAAGGGDYQGDDTICPDVDCLQPRGACCFEDGSCAELTDDDCVASGGLWQGPFTLCKPNPCPQLPGACCYEDGSCTFVTEERCVNTGGVWQGPFVSCDDQCPQPRGACCFPDGSCEELTQADCGAFGGVYQGDFTFCADIDCTQPPGACCFKDGSCSFVTAQRCADAGGQYTADGVPCEDAQCPQPPGACCFADGTCEDLRQDDCAAVGGSYQGAFTACATTECPPPKLACCFDDGSCTALTPEACDAAGGAVQTGAPTCADVMCPQPTGACCFVTLGGDACVERTQDECEDSGGLYQGDGTSCDAAFCSDGACCFPDGSCGVVGGAADCEEQGGEYQGDLSTCEKLDCTQPPGACCLDDGSCIEVRQAACADKGGLFQGGFTTCSDAGCPPLKFACCLADGACAVLTPEECLDQGGAVQKDAGTCADVDCASTRSYTSELVTREISFDLDPTVINIDVPDSGTIASVKAVDLIALSHTWAGDVTITLEHDGVTVTLLDRPGVPESTFGDDSDFDGSVYTWVDGGFVYDEAVFDGTVPSDMTYGPIPPSALADFVGLDKFGRWTLTISDAAGGDDGAIDGFRLTMNNGEPITGACCLPDGSCLEEVEGMCALAGGTYQGGSTCALVTCVTTFCTGDIAGAGNAPDGVVDFQDLLTLLSDWGTCARCPGDLDGDGEVGFTDLVTMLGAWGPCDG